MWFLALLTPRNILVIALTGALAFSHFVSYRLGFKNAETSFRAQIAEMREQHAEQVAAELLKAREREVRLTNSVDKFKKEKTREITRINARLADALERLRSRPEARATAGDVPYPASPGLGCTGAGLARPDGEFLAGYASDAARLQEALNFCTQQYNLVRDELLGRTK